MNNPRFDVSGQYLREKGVNHLVSNSKDYLTLDITFSEEWHDLNITGYFVNVRYPVIYKSSVNEHGEIKVPHSIYEDFWFYLVGTDMFQQQVITTNKIKVKMLQGGFGGNPAGDTDIHVVYDGGNEDGEHDNPPGEQDKYLHIIYDGGDEDA